MYLQYVTTLSKTYCQMFAKIEDKRNRLEKVLHKLENIAGRMCVLMSVRLFFQQLGYS